jgi:DNA invertase Pin-like site-specific DNA recombinase
MLIGYARVSTDDQNLDLQLDALLKAGCSKDKIYPDTISSGKADRPGLKQALDQLRAGDTLVVWRLDRLGRSLQELIGLINGIRAKGADFKSLTENMDTNTSGGKLVFHFFGALAEYERSIIRERTNAGLQAARARGRLGGRPKLAVDAAKRKKIERWRERSMLTRLTTSRIFAIRCIYLEVRCIGGWGRAKMDRTRR